MKTLNLNLQFIVQIAKVNSLLLRKFDGGLGGLGFTEFVILSHLADAVDTKLRRIDLANKVGLTASGITRILLPMEKVGYIQREINPLDARVSYVLLAPGGKRMLGEIVEQAQSLADEILPEEKAVQVASSSLLFSDLMGTIV